ncbi:hypothetical protein ACSVBT_06500 [Afipia sp. TerB]
MWRAAAATAAVRHHASLDGGRRLRPACFDAAAALLHAPHDDRAADRLATFFKRGIAGLRLGGNGKENEGETEKTSRKIRACGFHAINPVQYLPVFSGPQTQALKQKLVRQRNVCEIECSREAVPTKKRFKKRSLT